MTKGTPFVFARDIAEWSGVSTETAQRWLTARRFGPTVKVGRRLAMLREDYLEHFKRQAVNAETEET